MPRKDKCFSKCRARPKPDCRPDECYYTNGRKYQYCRLAFTKKMGPDCVPVPRQRNTHKRTPKHKSPDSIAQYPGDTESPVLDLNPDKAEIARFAQKYAKKSATRKIGRFLKTNKHKIRARFLQSVCSDAGVCIAFGTESQTIRKHFDDFDHFRFMSKPAERIGAVSHNGFVKELTYFNAGYHANAILKSSADQGADNLLYEALVGFFLNRYSTHYPSFLETYGLYQYAADGLAYYEMRTKKRTNPEILSVGLNRVAKSSAEIDHTIIKQSCDNSLSMAVLIQHLKGADTIYNKCKAKTFLTNDLLYVLYQVYASLAAISAIFTHYDLHYNNVLVYEPVKGKHIEYHYHIYGEEIIFRSKYLAKIIDYGRSYFNRLGDESEKGNSTNFYEALCKVCEPDCGIDAGFSWLRPEPLKELKSRYFMNSAFANPSHDLRLLSMLNGLGIGIDGKLKSVLGKVVYGANLSKSNKIYGTEPNSESGLPTKINNVMDAFEALHELVQDPAAINANNDAYQRSVKLGELHIYNNGMTPMRYVPA